MPYIEFFLRNEVHSVCHVLFVVSINSFEKNAHFLYHEILIKWPIEEPYLSHYSGEHVIQAKKKKMISFL